MDRMGARPEVRIRGKSRIPEHDRRAEREQSRGSHWPPGRQEKPLARSFIRPYRTPTLVGKEKALKVDERSSVKELGKLTPYLWKKGCLSSEVGFPYSVRRLQQIGSSDCLPKTQVSANAQADV